MKKLNCANSLKAHEKADRNNRKGDPSDSRRPHVGSDHCDELR